MRTHLHLKDIKEIEFLEESVKLEKVLIIEGLVRKIKGLHQLHNLKELYLYSNRISKMENMHMLEKLEVRCKVLEERSILG